MKLHKEFNIVAGVVFLLIFAIGASEAGDIHMQTNLVSIFLMLFGVLGLISQFVLLNISLSTKK